MPSVHAFDFLHQENSDLPPLCALVGDDRFLKRLVLEHLRSSPDVDDDGAQFDGRKAEWRDIADELSTRSLFGSGGTRLVVMDGADEFVSRHRPQLEALTEGPPSTGCLVLDLKTLASNTRLFKSIDSHGIIVDCKPPQIKRGKSTSVDETRIRKWIVSWGQSTHQVQLKGGAEEELLELVGIDLGRLDQELAKLALFVDADGAVTIELVRRIVGGWKTKTSWELIDAALDGNAAEAMLQLERLLQAGEAPQMIAGALVWSLRRFADAAQLVLEAEQEGRRISLPMALEQAGVRKWPKGALQRAERQLRQLGRHRAGQLYQQLLELDLSLKGSHAAPQRSRWALEKFILSLSRQAA